MFSEFQLDFWTIIGFISQACFFSRFLIQWLVSEKEKKSTIPPIFWYLSIAGAILITIYAIGRRDVVFLTVGILQLFIYSRNILLELRGGRTKDNLTV